jgi:hypothetical protein
LKFEFPDSGWGAAAGASDLFKISHRHQYCFLPNSQQFLNAFPCRGQFIGGFTADRPRWLIAKEVRSTLNVQ